MKTFLLLAVSVSIALAGAARAEDQDKVKQSKKQTKATQPARAVTPVTQHYNPKPAQTQQYHPKVQPTARTYTPVTPKTNMPRTDMKTPADARVPNKTWQSNYSQKKNYNPQVQKKDWQNESHPNGTVQKKTWQNKTNPNPTLSNRNWQNNNNQNTTVQNKNWQHQNQNQNRNWNSVTWAEARRRHHRDHHDRHWWTSHYTRFALFGAGYYFWDGGYWYPAYGYDPGYNSYSYDEPIYGYNDLDPAQVIANVQTELQRLGYYRDAVDGTMGPATRAALANYQRDTGLSITAAIDGPTLHSLGLE